ncbi:protein translocase subunit SecF [Saccharomonospora cyanea]|uniref:Protein-export membrane protein SecF n=1 Tax=Saccharomonospora cyanea NA-134 TaxID=882082 RepID=H5XIZ4_9PSEU|nr:protein translocase subunit SecF [Saccharomonospora cyanea]EHR60768.1 protein-export membrane protein, SecD/SecF family [Saccharomonospora cyanea NA-134]
MAKSDPTTTNATTDAPAKESVFQRLYTGTGAFDIVGHRKRWFVFFGALILACIATMGIRGFNLGIEFEGGTQIQLPAAGAEGPITTDEASDAFADAMGTNPAEAQQVGTGESATIQLRSETLEPNEVQQVKQALFEQLQPVDASGQPSQQVISDSRVSATWGGEISRQALIALAVFLVLVAVFLILYFETWMAVSALIALLHDVVVTAGVYALVGFEVTPATAIGLLTILGYSLYDTVVVFDKVKENTRGILNLTRRTYAEAANLALNQTLMRSINTSVIALLPVLGLLVIGYLLLGSGTLQDLALVLLTGMLAGTLSSVCLATPLLVAFKMREPKYRKQAEKVRARRENQARKLGAENGSALADDDFNPADDEQLAAELRREKAYAAAASVPARHPKSTQQRSAARPTGKRKR